MNYATKRQIVVLISLTMAISVVAQSDWYQKSKKYSAKVVQAAKENKRAIIAVAVAATLTAAIAMGVIKTNNEQKTNAKITAMVNGILFRAGWSPTQTQLDFVLETALNNNEATIRNIIDERFKNAPAGRETLKQQMLATTIELRKALVQNNIVKS